MASKFTTRAQPKRTRVAYTYRPTNSFKDEERVLYRRLFIIFIFIISVSAGLYLWGVEVVAALGGVWRYVLPEAQIVNVQPTDALQEPLLAPRVDPLPTVTNLKTIELKGWAQAGYEVKIFANDKEIAQILADKNGRFEYTGVELVEGENVVYTTTVFNKRESEPSQKMMVTRDTVKPQLTVDFGSINEEEGTMEISGQTETDTIVTVNERRVILESNGSFSHTYTLSSGENKIKVQSEDPAGNTQIKETTVEYTSGDEPE